MHKTQRLMALGIVWQFETMKWVVNIDVIRLDRTRL